MNKMPLVSIIIPVFNVEKYLYNCLNSVISQTYKNLEIIIVDDGSTDKSLEISQEFSKNDLRFKIFLQGNKGPSAARNKGLKEAKGKYFFFLDSDDTIDKQLIKHMVTFAEKNNVEITFCGTTFEGKEFHKEYPENDKKISNIQVARMSLRNKNGILHSPWGKLFRREIHKELRFPTDMKYYEDEYVIYDIILKSTVGVISKDTYHYNIRSNSLITNKATVTEKTNDFKKTIQHISRLFTNDYSILKWDYMYRFILDNITIIKYNISKKADNDTLFWGINNIRNMSLSKVINSKLGINLFLECICIKYFPELFKKIYKNHNSD